MYVIPPVIQTSVNFSFSTYIFPADITPDMLNLCKVTNKSKSALSSAGIRF